MYTVQETCLFIIKIVYPCMLNATIDCVIVMCYALHKQFLLFQDEKNQIMTTNVWLNLVRQF